MAFAGVEKLPEHEGDIIWQIAARLSTYKKLGKSNALDKAKRKIEKAKAQVHAKIELLFRVIKRQPSHIKTRFRGLAKKKSQLMNLFTLSNLWMARWYFLTTAQEVYL